MTDDKRFMGLAIKKALESVREGNSPFGSCIVKDGKVISVAHNTVLAKKDPTNHAEINAIRLACKKVRSYDLRGCTVYSTTEPCPMCFSAIHWAKADAIVFGTEIGDVQKLGFSELTLSNERMKRLGHSKIRIKGGFMRKECLALLSVWKMKRGKRTY
jgi:guanine deaminase